jgi:hypothetical protein
MDNSNTEWRSVVGFMLQPFYLKEENSWYQLNMSCVGSRLGGIRKHLCTSQKLKFSDPGYDLTELHWLVLM